MLTNKNAWFDVAREWWRRAMMMMMKARRDGVRVWDFPCEQPSLLLLIAFLCFSVWAFLESLWAHFRRRRRPLSSLLSLSLGLNPAALSVLNFLEGVDKWTLWTCELVWILARERQGRRREERDSYIQRMAERMADWLVLCMALICCCCCIWRRRIQFFSTRWRWLSLV